MAALNKARDELDQLLRKYRRDPTNIRWDEREITRRVRIVHAEIEKIRDICDDIKRCDSTQRQAMRAVLLDMSTKANLFEKFIRDKIAEHKQLMASTKRRPGGLSDDDWDDEESVDGFSAPLPSNKRQYQVPSNGSGDNQPPYTEKDGAVGGTPAATAKKGRLRSAVTQPSATGTGQAQAILVQPMRRTFIERPPARAATAGDCFVCNGTDHFPHRCPGFLIISRRAREAVVTEFNACANCLRTDHTAVDCERSGCWHCNEPHNSLLCPRGPRN